ncbi:MAG: YqgE/AlgH family protein [Proteobacteria bacterium]|nr:YqgE/AlgH family protein [Pseudomonadota bacterium]MBU1388791.1 YqgE/AlgH family protein [Pseudomonadota bacterium]MBU1543132.1 YqgE/AlgH family protein [Pseudomonadota bacterium]MBU2481722.1 YqgE/AlgH family protein [Pseudomonadota bacterium]
MTDEFVQSIKGQFLLAIPGLPDPNFAQTVTCMCEHNESGALGFIINRVHPLLTAPELFDDLNIKYDSSLENQEIYLGGPVQPSGVFVLHGPPFDWNETLKVSDWMALSNSRDVLEAIAAKQGPESFMILLGCAGWGPMQLDHELSDSAWLTCPISRDIIFSTPTELRYDKAMMMIY